MAVLMLLVLANVVFESSPLLVLNSQMKSSTITQADEDSKDKETMSLLFLVMGEARYFPRWYDLLCEVSSPALTTFPDANFLRVDPAMIQTTLVYGTYDAFIAPDMHPDISCQSDPLYRKEEAPKGQQQPSNISCHTRYVVNTTWTQGRNQLAKEAILLEHQRQSKFDFWIFLDDDVRFQCLMPGGHDEVDCWRRFLYYLTSPKLPSKVTTLSARIMKSNTFVRNNTSEFFVTSKPDASVAAWRRDAVPYMLPYARISKDHSEWTSQAVLFCVLMTCMPHSALYTAGIGATNREHRDYQRRNFTPRNIAIDTEHSYGNYIPDMSRKCLNYDYHQPMGLWGPYSDFDSAISKIPEPNKTTSSYCAPSADRFLAWEQSIVRQEE